MATRQDDSAAIAAISGSTEVAEAPTNVARIGQRIRRARLAMNLTQGDLAKGLFSVSYISAVERGQIRPSLGALERIATRLAIPTAELMGDAHDAEIDAALASSSYVIGDADHSRNQQLLHSAMGHWRHGDYAEAMAECEEMVGTRGSPREIGSAWWIIGNCHLEQGRYREAIHSLRTGRDLAEKVMDRELLDWCQRDLGVAHLENGSPVQALLCHAACYESITRGIMRDPRHAVKVLRSLAEEYRQLGDTERESEIVAVLGQAANTAINPHDRGEVYWEMASAARDSQRTAEAKRYEMMAMQAFEEAESRSDVAYLHLRVGREYLDRGEMDDAEAHIQMAADAAARIRENVAVALDVQLALARLDVARGGYDAALDKVDRARDLDALPRQLAEAAIIRAAVHLGAGHKREVATALKAADKVVSGLRPRDQVPYLVEAAKIAKAQPDHAAALGYMEWAWSAAGHRM